MLLKGLFVCFFRQIIYSLLVWISQVSSSIFHFRNSAAKDSTAKAGGLKAPVKGKPLQPQEQLNIQKINIPFYISLLKRLIFQSFYKRSTIEEKPLKTQHPSTSSTLCLLVSSPDNLWKQFRLRPGPPNWRA